jgi:hypothetical protein
MIETPLINSFFLQLKYLDIKTSMLMYFYMIMPMPFGASKGSKALFFLFQSLFFIKKLSYIAKDASISILNRLIAVGLATFRLPPLENTPPITTTTDLLEAVGC